MIKNERVRERIEDVRQWLEENVRVYPHAHQHHRMQH
jgi:hypothetical protein